MRKYVNRPRHTPLLLVKCVHGSVSVTDAAECSALPHQCLCEQLCPVLRRELERLRLLATAFAECEVELCSLTFSHWADTTDVPIRPLSNTDSNNTKDKHC